MGNKSAKQMSVEEAIITVNTSISSQNLSRQQNVMTNFVWNNLKKFREADLPYIFEVLTLIYGRLKMVSGYDNDHSALTHCNCQQFFIDVMWLFNALIQYEGKIIESIKKIWIAQLLCKLSDLFNPEQFGMTDDGQKPAEQFLKATALTAAENNSGTGNTFEQLFLQMHAAVLLNKLPEPLMNNS